MSSRAPAKAAPAPRRAAPGAKPSAKKQRRVAPTAVGSSEGAASGVTAAGRSDGAGARSGAAAGRARSRSPRKRADTTDDLAKRYEATVKSIATDLKNQREAMAAAYEINPYETNLTSLRVQVQELKRTLDTAQKQYQRLQTKVNELLTIDAMVSDQERATYEAIHPVKIESGPLKGMWRCSEASGPQCICTAGRSHSGRQGFRPNRELKKVRKHIERVHAPDVGARRYRRETKTQELADWVA